MSALVLLMSCGGAKQPEAKSPPPAQEPTPAPMEAEAPDLSPVARPAELVAVTRIAKPRQLVETLTQWANLPLKLEDMMPSDLRGVSSAVLWDAPIEAVLMLDPFGEGKFPPPLLAASLGLKSLEAGLSAAESMQLQTRRLAPGVYRVGDFEGTSCAMAASLGTAPARIVCGNRPKDVDSLLPYLTRGLPTEPQSGADFELTADAKPLQARYGNDVSGLRLLAGVAVRQVALDVPRFDRALSDVIYGSVDESINLFNDLEQLKIEARFDPARSTLLGSAELKLKGETSWLAGTLAAQKPTPVPTTLARIPLDATMAGYTTGTPTERWEPIARVVGELIEGYLESEKLPEATRKRARRALDGWFTKVPEAMFFVSPNTGATALDAPDTTLSRLSEPSPRVMSAYTELFALLSDPAVKRWTKQKFKIDDKAFPKVTKKALKLPGFKAPATVWELQIDMKALAAADESLASAFERFSKRTSQKSALRFLVAVQPDGDATYLLAGGDTKEMARIMAEHKKSEPGLAFAKPVRADKVTAAYFFNLKYIGRYIDGMTGKKEVAKAIASAPRHGETPIPFSFTASAGAARFEFELPSVVISDASTAAVGAASSLKGAFDN